MADSLTVTLGSGGTAKIVLHAANLDEMKERLGHASLKWLERKRDV